MRELDAADFARFFKELWGNPPFAWQRRLASMVLEPANASDAWPEAIALPAASGKTACMDVAVFALAAQSSRLAGGGKITAPRRIFFVVDRRVIVDQAYERARAICERLQKAQEGILREVADRLRQIARGETKGFGDEIPLAAHWLRGGMYRSDAWARDPLQPMIVTSTVDQIGSRLLFRAYGRGNHTWPIYAGLVANDSLILLDEAHCAQPFLQTLRAVQHFQTWADEPLGRSFYPVVMSATPPPSQRIFEDESEQCRDPRHPLGKRQLARKPATLKIVRGAAGADAAARLAEAMCESAFEMIGGGLRAVVVFSNRVATARMAHKMAKSKNQDVEAILLTGRMRPVDKDAVVNRLKDLRLHSDQSSGRDLDKPVIVVATQTLEVGADLDFDGLVTECASLDALRQRFGRLNRMGRSVDCRAVILIRADQAKPKRGKEDDPIYGAALTKTWKWLEGRRDQNGEVDFGIAYMDQTLDREEYVDLNAPSRNAPVMLPAHVDCWGQTAPVPEPSPDVSLFLRGPARAAPTVQVCWRAGLNLADKKKEALELLELCPPSSSETLPVPLGVIKGWLAGKMEADYSADVEGTGGDADQDYEARPEKRSVVIWKREIKCVNEHITSNPNDIKPWDVIVIPTSASGAFDQLGDLPPDARGAVLDVGDRAYRLAHAKPILHLHAELVKAWPRGVVAKAAARDLLKDLERKHDGDELADPLYDILIELAEPSPSKHHLRDAARELLEEYKGPEAVGAAYRVIGDGHLLIIGRRRLKHLTQGEAFNDGDDASSSGTSHRNGRPVKLADHLRGVREFARRYAVGCGLRGRLADAVACAGLLHDLGKADPRFQSMLMGGKWSGEPYAKSAGYPKGRAARRSARVAAGYPKGRPHPLLSVRLAESAPDLLPKDDGLRDLVLHLVASHHGHCRPFAHIVYDERPTPVRFTLNGHRTEWSGPTGLERLDSGVAERYWRLARRYGWWGLAWLEAMLRLADWRRSEWEETHDYT